MPSKKPTLKDWIMVPILLLATAAILPLLWIKRKFQRKSFSAARLFVSADEMRLIEEASRAQESILINDVAFYLRPFDAEKQHTHSNCGSCPNELHLNDVKDRPRLTASREIGEDLWSLAAMEPIAWVLLGHTSSDLVSLRVGDTLIGRSDDSPRAIT